MKMRTHRLIARQGLSRQPGWQFGDFGPPTPNYLRKHKSPESHIALPGPLSARCLPVHAWMASLIA
jgi:hypothetical protein